MGRRHTDLLNCSSDQKEAHEPWQHCQPGPQHLSDIKLRNKTSQTNGERTQLRAQTESAEWGRHTGLRTKKWTSWLRRNERNSRLSLHCKFRKENASPRPPLTVSVQINEFILYGASEWFYIFYSSALHAKTPRTAISSSNNQQFVCIPTEGTVKTLLAREERGMKRRKSEKRERGMDRGVAKEVKEERGGVKSVFTWTDVGKDEDKKGNVRPPKLYRRGSIFSGLSNYTADTPSHPCDVWNHL